MYACYKAGNLLSLDVTKGIVHGSLSVKEFMNLASQKRFDLTLVPSLLRVLLKIGDGLEIVNKLTRCASPDGVDVLFFRIPRPRVDSMIAPKLV